MDTNVGSSDPLPVIASPSSSNLVIAYRSGGNIVTKHSANNGLSWPTTRMLSGSANNSPSVAPGKTPWSANATVLAYATGEIPNSSDIIADYNYNTTWMSPKNLTSGLPGNLSQHSHPCIAFSGDFQNTTHVSWDAYDSFRLARVILHKKMTSWNNPGTYYEFAYQTEDRPTITGLAGARAAMLFRRGPENFFRGDYDGSNWSITFPTFAGKHASLSVGQTQARYVITSAGNAPYQVQLSTTTLSKGTAAGQTVALSRSAGFVHPASGGWLNIRIREYRVQHQDGSLSRVAFEAAPPDTGELDVGQVLAAVGSGEFVLPADAEFLHLTFSVAGKLVARLAQEAGPLALQFKAVAHGATVQEFDFPKLTLADTESFLLAGESLSLPATDLRQASGVSFRMEVINQKRDASVVASLGRIYEIRDEPGPALPKLATRNAIPLPASFALEQNYPNPFNPETKIRYLLPQSATVRLVIYNLQGQEVRTFLFGLQAVGEHTVVWDGRDSAGRQVGSGVYVYKLSVQAAGVRKVEQSRKLVLVR